MLDFRTDERPATRPGTGGAAPRPHAHPVPGAGRPRAAGKFLVVGGETLWVKGVTYGTFRTREDGSEWPARDVVERDFAEMAARGINSVRTYIPPPHWLLDAARDAGLWVMVGLAWEQHVAFLDDRAIADRIEGRIRDGVRACAGHPAVLCFAIGNEIPAGIVRWHGRRRVERFLHRLYRAAKSWDPGALVTYVNFPTTEHLQLPFLDLQCFNVYLEARDRLEAYLAKLQTLAGESPLLMAEIGLDSRRNGEAAQAEALGWQVRSAFAEGCAGTFVFAWTDEWARGGVDIDDWDFGLTTRGRAPKPALDAVAAAYAEAPFAPGRDWPRISVVVCSYNGAATIRDTLEGLSRLAYPDFEVIVVDDGSTDDTARIAAGHDVRLISTPNRGLSEARNTGWREATGEIVAYIDDDAWPEPHWLHYLAHRFMETDFVGVGGPNFAPAGDRPVAQCVYNAPGGPVHVLLSDTVAEHIPGCNMAFRREALEAIGGFDARFRTAGDDVDICWRLQDAGGVIGFHAGAMNWHHRRPSIRAYWRQQKGYGRAEALLEAKWPERYNALGHIAWGGRLYGAGLTRAIGALSGRIYGGPAGSAPFQPLYQPATGVLSSLPLMPEWYLLAGALVLLSTLGLSWPPLLWALPLALLALAAPVAQAVFSAAGARFRECGGGPLAAARLRAITAGLHLIQPVARLAGRIRHGLTIWRQRSSALRRRPPVSRPTLWREEWQDPFALLAEIGATLRRARVINRAGGDYDGWDLEVRGGAFGAARLNMAVEEHGAGRQLFRFRVVQRPSRLALGVAAAFAAAALGAASDGAWSAAAASAALAAVLLYLVARDASVAVASAEAAVEAQDGR